MFKKSLRFIVVCAFMAASLSLASAAVINFGPITVFGTDVFSGSSITLAAGATGADMLSVSATGIASLQAGGAYGTNAAGVVVVPGSLGIGQSSINPGPDFTGTTFGSLLLGNTTVGFKQVFPTNAANGLGSLAPPNTVNANTTVGALFGGGLAAGTTLQLRTSDINTFDNGGQYVVTISQTTSAGPAGVPEPGTWTLSLSALAGTMLLRRRS